MSEVFLVVGPYCWGRGTTLAAAKSRAREELMDSVVRAYERLGKPIEWLVFKSSDPKVYVDRMGSICYKDGTTLEQVK